MYYKLLYANIHYMAISDLTLNFRLFVKNFKIFLSNFAETLGLNRVVFTPYLWGKR